MKMNNCCLCLDIMPLSWLCLKASFITVASQSDKFYFSENVFGQNSSSRINVIRLALC